MTIRAALLVAIAASSAVGATRADTLHKMQGDVYQHHGSSWIFPPRIGGFARVGAPQDVDGTIDVVAYYAQDTSAGRMLAIVDVYPPDSYAAEASFDAASAALQAELHSTSLERSELRIANDVPLVAVKATAPAQAFGALYFIDTGAWIVKIRVRLEHAAAAAAAASDEFVRQQPWSSLELTPAACTGPACPQGTSE